MERETKRGERRGREFLIFFNDVYFSKLLRILHLW
jgi:hypothetical protein